MVIQRAVGEVTPVGVPDTLRGQDGLARVHAGGHAVDKQNELAVDEMEDLVLGSLDVVRGRGTAVGGGLHHADAVAAVAVGDREGDQAVEEPEHV